MNEQHRRTQRRPAVAPVEEPARSPFSGVAGRFAAWITGADRIPDYEDFDEFETDYVVYDDELEERGRPMRQRGRAAERARAAERGRGAAARAREARQSRRSRAMDPDELEAQEMPVIDEPGDELPQQQPAPEPIAMGEPSRFPLTGLGYDREAVDEHLTAIERELDRLRAQSEAPVSVAEELERLGEQTASILVVAHDQAQETARLAREEAERRVADAHAEA
ncbi:MAG: DivIVA domain-containing protein, partial [Solirubrobacteraceae bacterium]